MGDESPFAAIVMWIALAIAGAFILLLVGYLLIELFRYLAGRTRKPVDDAARADPWSWLKAFFRAIARLAARLFGFGRRRAAEPSARAAEAYARLFAGGRSGRSRARGQRDAPGVRAAAPRHDLPGTAGRAAFIAQEVEKEVVRRRGQLIPTPSAAAQLRGDCGRSN